MDKTKAVKDNYNRQLSTLKANVKSIAKES